MTPESYVYVVGGSRGDYSDRTDWNICVCYSEDRAKEIVNKLEELQEFNNEFSKRLQQEIQDNSWREYRSPPQPRPSDEYVELNKIKKTTPELKAIHKRLQQEHNERLAVWKQECEAILQLGKQALQEYKTKRKQWIEDNYHLPEHLQEVKQFTNNDFTPGYDDTTYAYSKVKEIL
jgi:gas vesicle protein